MAAAADETERVFGKLHVLVNNAGVGIQGPFKGITYADWDFGLSVNLGGVVNGLQTFLPRIRAHGEGGHVNTASLAALVPMPAQFVTYVAAKAAVVTISETIRGELMQENIGVSVLCPGPIRTNIHELSKNRPAKFGVGDAFRAAMRLAQPGCRFPACWSLQRWARWCEGPHDGLHHHAWRMAAHGRTRHAATITAMPVKLIRRCQCGRLQPAADKRRSTQPCAVNQLSSRDLHVGHHADGRQSPESTAHSRRRASNSRARMSICTSSSSTNPGSWRSTGGSGAYARSRCASSSRRPP
jgi:hypothetical protein